MPGAPNEVDSPDLDASGTQNVRLPVVSDHDCIFRSDSQVGQGHLKNLRVGLGVSDMDRPDKGVEVVLYAQQQGRPFLIDAVGHHGDLRAHRAELFSTSAVSGYKTEFSVKWLWATGLNLSGSTVRSKLLVNLRSEALNMSSMTESSLG